MKARPFLVAIAVGVSLLAIAQWLSSTTRRPAPPRRSVSETARNRALIAEGLKANRGRERAYLDSSIRARMHDRRFLITALQFDSISPDVLDTLARFGDRALALEAIRHPETSSETLARIHKSSEYPDYFIQALAAHRNTPPETLRELYRRPPTIIGLDIWFAANPATPRDVLSQLINTTTDRAVIGQLLENPALDCKLLSQLSETLLTRLKRDGEDRNVMRVAERVPEVCASMNKS